MKAALYCIIAKPDSVLLSHTISSAVPSAMKDFTSVFGMGTGVALSLYPPGKIILNYS